MIKEFLDKMIVFEQIIRDINIEYKRIRLILFYDVVKKDNYQKNLEEILRKYNLKARCPKYYKKIYFQIFYMDASYFAASLKRFEDTIDMLETNYQELSGKYEEVIKSLNIEKGKNQDLSGKYGDVIKRLELQEKLIQIMSENMDEETKKKCN